MSGQELSSSWGLESFASFDRLNVLAAMVGVDRGAVHGASVGDWLHITQGSFGRQLQGKKSDVEFCLKLGKNDGRGWRAGVMDTHPTSYKNLSRLDVCDGSAVVSIKGAGDKRVKIFAAATVTVPSTLNPTASVIWRTRIQNK